MNDAAQEQARDIRELLSSLRQRRSALINHLRNGGPEAPEWMCNLAQLRAVQEAIDLVKIAQSDQDDYRPSYHGESEAQGAAVRRSYSRFFSANRDVVDNVLPGN